MSDFEFSRSTTVVAEPAEVHALIDDFRAWPRWSPWEDVDPDLQRTYSGADKGVGAHYAWKGNRKAGEGSMEITGSTPDQVDIKLVFMKPWSAANDVRFTLVPAGDGTEVTWTMAGEHKGMAGLFTRVVGMDRLVGKDFDRGLARLKAAAEVNGGD
jgi:hypothetical protein